MSPAGLVRRAFAGVVDALLLAVALAAAAALARRGVDGWISRQVLDPEGRLFEHSRVVLGRVQLALAATLPLLYFALWEALPPQATPGKWLFGCRVRRRDGARAGVARVAWRTLLKPVSLAPCGVGLLLAGLGSRRALHDRLSGCAVLRR